MNITEQTARLFRIIGSKFSEKVQRAEPARQSVPQIYLQYYDERTWQCRITL